MAVKPLTILFIDSGNASASIIAEALLRHKGGNRHKAVSGGTAALGKLNPRAIACLKKHDVKTDDLGSKSVAVYAAAEQAVKVDVVITLDDAAQAMCPPFLGRPVKAHWPVEAIDSAPEAQQEWMIEKAYLALEQRIEAMLLEDLSVAHGELQNELQRIGKVG